MSDARVNDNSLTPMFLAACSDVELVALQHGLRAFAEDRANLNAVLQELGRRHRRLIEQRNTDETPA